MSVQMEQLNSVQRKFSVTVDAEEVTKAFEAAYKKLQKKVSIKGFRPGKAPVAMVKKMYGDSVAHEVSEDLIKKTLFPGIEENDTKPIAPPVVDNSEVPKSGEPFSFSAVVDIMPEVSIEGFKELEVSLKKVNVDADAVDAELKAVARQKAKTSPIEDGEKVAEKGKLAVISHHATVDGQAIQEMDAKEFPVGLGRDELLPALEEGILGMKVDEEKTIDIELPNEFGDPKLNGKSAKVTVTLNDVMNLDVPDVDDELAKDLDFDDVAALKSNVEERLMAYHEDRYSNELEDRLMTSLRDKNGFEVPPAIVDEVTDSIIKERMQKQDEEEVQKVLKNEDIRKQLRDEAIAKAKNTLMLFEVAKVESIEITDEDITERIKAMVPENTEEKLLEGYVQSIGPRIRENLSLEKALDVIKSNAKITHID